MLIHHYLIQLPHTAIDLPAIPWALAMPHKTAVEATSLYCHLTVFHLPQLVSLPRHNAYRMPKRIRHLYLINLSNRRQPAHPLFTRQRARGTIDWTPTFVRGCKMTPSHSETSVTKKIIRDPSLGFEICLMPQVRYLYDNPLLSLPDTFTPCHCTLTYDNDRSKKNITVGLIFMDSRRWGRRTNHHLYVSSDKIVLQLYSSCRTHSSHHHHHANFTYLLTHGRTNGLLNQFFSLA